jgi:hypothetical protein
VEFVAHKPVMLGGMRYARGSVVPADVVAASFNCDALINAGFLKKQVVGAVKRERPKVEPMPPKPMVELNHDHLKDYAALVAQFAAADPLQSWANAEQTASFAAPALHDRAVMQWAFMPKTEDGTPLPPDSSEATHYRRTGRRISTGLLQHICQIAR